ncbi:MAG TPA: Si-specific NAD(P)(+) transhydrogenase [Vicinamibacterales bacterium]|nr:Si-specific NAD(P)(+) transhydrogenase [Vicinamibacterales bacterium]HPW19472.1 Si-specific NAD(P)(+) transhydrogenase [Vicinamibacterales bacterium]
MNTFDVVVVGGGPGGERAAIQAARAGKRVALVERENVVGGMRVNWGTIPSKTLRESAVFVHGLRHNRLDGIKVEIADTITIPELKYREQRVVQRELELILSSLTRYAIEIVRGEGRFVDPHTVAVHGADGRMRLRLRGDVIVIAVGSSPNRPADVRFDDETVFDSTTVLRLPRMPQSMIVLGAGVIGVEYASIFSALGVAVTLVDTRADLLPFVDREIASLLRRELQRLGTVFVPNDQYAAVERIDGAPPAVRVTTRSGNVLEADALLYCVGRDGNTRGIGLEAIGITPDPRGLIKVNEHFQTAHPHIYAVGDVVGYPALASTSMEQGRQAIRHAFGIPGPRLRTERLPFAIYAIPEVSYIGETEEALRQQGLPYVVGRGHYEMNPRGQIVGASGGLVKLLFARETMRLAGVHIIGHTASELIHTGQAFLDSGADATHIAETLYNYPTFSDMYRHAALVALRAAADDAPPPAA